MVRMKKIGPSFPLLGNDRAVDFVNTRVMLGGACVDLLASPEATRDWFAAAHIPVAGKIGAPEHRGALDLRDAIAALFTAFRRNATPPSDALAIVNGHLAAYPTSQRLVFGCDGYRLTDVDTPRSLPKALATLAHDAAVLVTETPRAALRACASDKCVLIFKDNSRGQRRRWCSMETCGNRAKAATHYRSLAVR